MDLTESNASLRNLNAELITQLEVLKSINEELTTKPCQPHRGKCQNYLPGGLCEGCAGEGEGCEC